jgi:hypothetical protein
MKNFPGFARLFTFSFLILILGGNLGCGKGSGDGGNKLISVPREATEKIKAGSDYTKELKLVPGMVFNRQVYDGVDTRGRLIGDYEVIQKINQAGSDGFNFNFRLTYPAKVVGDRGVDASDWQASHRFSSFYFNGERGLKRGFSSLLFSQEVFKELKEKGETAFSTDERKPPKSLKKVGDETLLSS